jgi:hypothetical protein
VVKVTDKARVACTTTCHATLLVKPGSEIAVLPQAGTLWKLAPWTGACEGTSATCKLGRSVVAAAFRRVSVSVGHPPLTVLTTVDLRHTKDIAPRLPID